MLLLFDLKRDILLSFFQKFLLKKNLLTHLKRIHESEGKGAKFKCSKCPKTFYYDADRVSWLVTELELSSSFNYNKYII